MTAPPTTWTEVSSSRTREAAEDAALVLEAVGISCGTAQVLGQYVLVVRSADAERARGELEKYTSENRGWPPRAASPRPLSRGVEAAVVYGVLLVLAYMTQRRESFGVDWWRAGCASADLIQGGAWWRSVTALCLHVDVLHLAGNVVFGALFGVMLAQSVGSGVAWLGFVMTGAIGNWLNAWLQSPSHVSVGASTAVFGMLGIQVAHDWMRRRHLHYGPLRRWAPLVIGLALLAWLGGGEQRVDPNDVSPKLVDLNLVIQKVDVGAHVLGFAAGLGLGALLGWRGRPVGSTTPRQAAFASAAIVVVVGAWVLAFRP